MSFTFRIRVNRAAVSTLETDASQIVVPTDEEGIRLVLQASPLEKSIKDAEQWVLRGEGYKDADAAWHAGTRYQDSLMLACAKNKVGVDFGLRTPSGMLTKAGELFYENQYNRRTIQNMHGLMVFESEPKPLFIQTTMTPRVGREIQLFETTLHAAIALKLALTDRERLALSLFSDSFFQTSAYSRFLLLVMAIEAMIEPKPKSSDAIAHVASFIEQIKSSTLGQEEKNSLVLQR